MSQAETRARRPGCLESRRRQSINSCGGRASGFQLGFNMPSTVVEDFGLAAVHHETVRCFLLITYENRGILVRAVPFQLWRLPGRRCQKGIETRWQRSLSHRSSTGIPSMFPRRGNGTVRPETVSGPQGTTRPSCTSTVVKPPRRSLPSSSLANRLSCAIRIRLTVGAWFAMSWSAGRTWPITFRHTANGVIHSLLCVLSLEHAQCQLAQHGARIVLEDA